jgi:hemolysin activation/secretion protein
MIMNRMKTIASILFALPLAAHAAPPGAGELLQQIQPSLPPAPSSNETGLKLEGAKGEKLPASRPFLVKKIEIVGNTLFDAATLHALVAGSEGSELTLPDLEKLAARITDYYHANGYPLSRAIIPAQTIHDGVVRIEVIEAKYGKIKLDNRSRVNSPLIQDTLSSLKGGSPIAQKQMDHALLLLSDVPGISVDATLKPGEKVATSDLNVVTEAAPFVSGSAMLDDYGNKYTGRNRLGATVFISNPLHHGDVLSVSGLSSGSGMNYGRVAYDTLLNGSGTHAGASYSALHYILGDSLSSLNGHGTADVGSAWMKHPIVRSRDLNLYGQIQYDNLKLRDHIDATGIRTDRHLDNVTGTLSGDNRNVDGVNTWSLDLTSGHVGFDDSAAQLADAATAQTQGSFSKWNLNLSRLQSLGPMTSLYAALSGQWANSNLDPSQQMVAGGPYTVRAYDMGVLSGDEGYLGTVELRHNLNSYWQAIAFWDSEHVTVNRNTWVAGTNSATLTGAGVGLNWTSGSWSVKTYVAARIDTPNALVPVSSATRVWVQLGKGF